MYFFQLHLTSFHALSEYMASGVVWAFPIYYLWRLDFPLGCSGDKFNVTLANIWLWMLPINLIVEIFLTLPHYKWIFLMILLLYKLQCDGDLCIIICLLVTLHYICISFSVELTFLTRGSNKIKRCGEMARKLNFFKEQMLKAGLSSKSSVSQVDINIDDLEVSYNFITS